jgi:D-arabinose 1-dehydrogenase-like Zn-dependent alcohol dehydrogenase
MKPKDLEPTTSSPALTRPAIKKLGGSFDLLISTVNVKLDWDAMIGTLAPNGRLHIVGAVVEPIPVSAFSLIMQQRKRLRFAGWLARGHWDDA